MRLAEDLAALGLQLAAAEQYESDESGCGRYPAQAVVLARDTADVQAVLKYARAAKLPVVPWGRGSCKSGAALTEKGGIPPLDGDGRRTRCPTR